jgi:sorbitol/mannitol transport system permease protein
MGRSKGMATQQTKTLARTMLAPSVVLLFIWMAVPLALTLWFSFQQYNPLNPIRDGFVGFSNYLLFFNNPAFLWSILNTLTIVVSVLVITLVGGILLALLLDQPMWGQGIVRILVISPFFVMPPVAALVWKNMIMHAEYGVISDLLRAVGMSPIDWFGRFPLLSIIIIVAWQWLPFATLILLTALQSLDGEQKEAAEMDGANFLDRFIHLTLPHLARAITVVILIQTIFLLSVYAEILVTTNGGPGYASTNLPFLVAQKATLEFKIGQASAGGIIAVILANIVAFFAMRAVGKNLDR